MIKVTKEGREGVFLVTKEEITKYIVENNLDNIHNFRGGGMMMIGCDCSQDSVLEQIANSDRIGLLTGDALANNLGHSLAVIIGNNLQMFDIGDVSDKLEINE